MGWFKKKEKVTEKLSTLKIITPPPVILRRSKIKPTVCYYCKCTYQATFENISRDSINAYGRAYVDCPMCGRRNAIEFEEDIDGMPTM